MKEIFNIGNLPNHLQVMAKEVQGQRSTKFFECFNAEELLNTAKEGNCEETTVTLDPTTERGFMVAFGFTDSSLEDLSGDKLVVMNIYYAELDASESKYYRNMLHRHRNDQEDNMQQRRASKAKKAKKLNIQLEKTNDK